VPHTRAAHDSWEIQRELRASPEWAHATRFDAFVPSVRLLEANAYELRRAVNYLTNDRRSILFDRIELEPWLEEIARLLHNVVAAVKTLVDHTRALVKDLYGDAGMPGYADRVETLLSNPVVPFVQETRHLFLHWKLPPIVHSSGDGWNRRLKLRKKDLLAWSRWTTPARKYLEDSPEYIEIAPLIEQYLALIREFYAWFEEQERVNHAAVYETVNAKLAASRQARAPAVFHELRDALSAIESGHRPLRGPFDALLDTDTRRQLQQLSDHLPLRVDAALARVAELYGEIPQDIVARFQAAAKRAT
jgi:hypothetical protein